MSFLLPGVASLVVSLILLILGQSTSVIALAAAATFPAVYLVLTQQGGAGAGAVGKALSAGKGLLEEEEEKLARKLSKKLKKVEEAKKKLAQKLHLQEEKQQSNSTQVSHHRRHFSTHLPLTTSSPLLLILHRLFCVSCDVALLVR